MTNLKEANYRKDIAKAKRIKKYLEELLEEGSLDNGLCIKGYFSAYGLENHYYSKNDEGKNIFLFVVWKSEKKTWKVVEEFIESYRIEVYEE